MCEGVMAELDDELARSVSCAVMPAASVRQPISSVTID